MPNKPLTQHRSVRVPDELWETAKKVARERDETVAEVVRRALLAYVEDWPGSS